jgi:hypothetical protein
MRNSLLRHGVKSRLLAAGSAAGLIAAVGVGVGLLGGPRAALARQTTQALTIFEGATAQASGLQLSSWGSGSVTEDQKNAYNNGKESLRVVTHGQFQGASLRLAKPVDLGSFVANKSAYLQVAFLFPALSERSGTGGPGGGLPGSSGGGKFGGPSGGPPGGPPGGGIPGSSGGGGSRPGGPQATTKPRAIENVRMVLGRPGGRGTEITLPLSNSVPDNTWRLLSVPVGSIPGITADNAKFSEIRLFGDNPGVMYVGRIAVVVDTTPIKLEPISDMSVEVRKPYRYSASANAGPTPLTYSWDWDTTDGIQEESIGRTVTHTYYKEGDMVGTLTVKDPYGVKASVKTTFKIHVHL